MYQPLLTPVYWVRPIYTELLHASSRLRKNTKVETARPSNGLVKSCAKIMCSPKALGEEPLNATTRVLHIGSAQRPMCNPCMFGFQLIGHPVFVLSSRLARPDSTLEEVGSPKRPGPGVRCQNNNPSGMELGLTMPR